MLESSEDLATVGKLTNLEVLELDECPITDRGLPHLEGLKKLKTLDLKDTKVTATGVERLRKALPGARIVEPRRK